MLPRWMFRTQPRREWRILGLPLDRVCIPSVRIVFVDIFVESAALGEVAAAVFAIPFVDVFLRVLPELGRFDVDAAAL